MGPHAQIMGHLLQRVEQHLPDFQRVRNATLVQDLNKPDTLSNTLEVGSPQLQNPARVHAVYTLPAA